MVLGSGLSTPGESGAKARRLRKSRHRRAAPDLGALLD